VFSRDAHVWDSLDHQPVVIMPPCIDVTSPKNQAMTADQSTAILQAAGIIDGAAASADATFVRADGERGVVVHRADAVEEEAVPAGARLVTQISRWDRLKDPVGVLRAFVDHGPGALGTLAPGPGDDHLVLAGPAVDGVTDDPESTEAFAEVSHAWRSLGPAARSRIHLVCLPMADLEENAAIVNALQRRSDVVVQKSLAEGFGLTVAEAMWKERPVVASRVGGIQDQVVDGESGVLVDPTDLAACGAAMSALLADGPGTTRMAHAARRRVEENFLLLHHLRRESQLFDAVLDDRLVLDGDGRAE
jgi:trehalose synthase